MTKLILLRHGESQWNLENRFTGSVDVPLSAKGEQEAVRAGELLKELPIEKVYTSILRRAIETAEIVTRVRGQHLLTERDKALNERCYGDLQGLNKADAAKKFGEAQVKLWRRSYDVRPPNGESLKDTADRTIPFLLGQILPEVKGGTDVLVIAHGNSLRSIVMYLDKLSPEEVLDLNIPTGVPLVYDMTSDGKISCATYLSDSEPLLVV
jgi:2,3-bisphosphoglycerate-dependent phosphoglycerate mutase